MAGAALALAPPLHLAILAIRPTHDHAKTIVGSSSQVFEGWHVPFQLLGSGSEELEKRGGAGYSMAQIGPLNRDGGGEFHAAAADDRGILRAPPLTPSETIMSRLPVWAVRNP